MKHYSEIELENYLDRRMFPVKRFFCARHLAQCAACRELLENCRRDREFVSELHHGVEEIEQTEEFIRNSTIQTDNRDCQ